MPREAALPLRAPCTTGSSELEPVAGRARAEQREVAAVADRRRRVGQRLTAAQASAPPTLTRCAPASTSSPKVSSGRASTFTGLVDAPQTTRGSPRDPQAGRVEDVGARGLERQQAGDRVIEVGVAADVVLGARGEREREAEPRAAATAAATRSTASSSS